MQMTDRVQNTHKALALLLCAGLLACQTASAMAQQSLGQASAQRLHAPVTSLTFSPDGNALLVTTHPAIRLLHWPSMTVIAETSAGFSHVHGAAFSPDGTRLATVGGTPGEKGGVELWMAASAASHEPLKKLHEWNIATDTLTCLAWQPDGAGLVVGGSDGQLTQMRWTVDPAEAETTRYGGHSQPVAGIAYSPAREWLSAGRDQLLTVWPADLTKPTRNLNQHTQAIVGLALSPAANANDAASCIAATVGEDRTVRFWQPNIGRMLRLARLEEDPLCCAFGYGGKRLVVGTHSGTIAHVVVHTAGVAENSQHTTHPITAVAVDSASNAVVYGDGQGNIQVIPGPDSE